MKPSIYVAAPWVRREEAQRVAEQLQSRGYRITHDWWAHEAGDEDTTELARLARLDLLATLNCDLFILLNLEKSEGKAVESGLALSRFFSSALYVRNQPQMFGVGTRGSNIFQHLPQWRWFDDVDALLAYLP